MANIFRQKSLDKLADPEQLDQLFTVTSPRAWIILVSICALLIVTIIWGIFGSIPTRVMGQGILISRGQGVYDATVKGDGLIKELLVTPGQQVRKGQIIAYLNAPFLARNVSQGEAYLQELQQKQANLKTFIERDNQLETQRHRDLRSYYAQTIANNQKHLEFLDKAIAQRQTVVKSGIITEQHLAELIREYHKTKQEIENLQNQIINSRLEEKRSLNNNQDKLAAIGLKLSAQERELVKLRAKYKAVTEVKSPAFGRVIEITAKRGAFLKADTKVASIEGLSEKLDAIIFVPAQNGKLIQPGMSAQVSPATAKKEEYGAIVGKVLSISRFPSTAEGIQAVIGNMHLVQEFMKQGPLLYTSIDLMEDPSIFSGFKWTSSKGPHLLITNGTLATASITVREQAPITLIIPALKRLFGVAS